MTAASETCLTCSHYGLVRIIEEDPGMTFAQICGEMPGVPNAMLRGDLIALCEQRLVTAKHFADEERKPLRYYITQKGVMMLRKFERESTQKRKQDTGFDNVWVVAAALLAVCLVVAYSSCAR